MSLGDHWLGKLAQIFRRSPNLESGRCPRCFALGTMDIVSQDSREIGRCRECGYETYDAAHTRMGQCFFAAIGNPCTGKTLWHAMLWRSLRFRIGCGDMAIDPVPAEKDIETREILDRLLSGDRASMSFAPRYGGSPDPSTYLVRRRPRSPQAILSHVYDVFSADARPDGFDVIARRMQHITGLFVFLDISDNPYFGPKLGPEGLIRFLQELRRARNLNLYEKLRIPIAVCLSKCDLLGTEHHQLLQDLQSNEHLEPPDLGIIAARSERLREYLPFLFPDQGYNFLVNEENFSNIAFFPMSVLGYQKMEMESPRRLNPSGIFDPFLWLLSRATGWK